MVCEEITETKRYKPKYRPWSGWKLTGAIYDVSLLDEVATSYIDPIMVMYGNYIRRHIKMPIVINPPVKYGVGYKPSIPRSIKYKTFDDN